MAAKARKKSTGADPNNRMVAQNRKARHDYDILDTYECGIALHGGEVKSLRDGKVALRDSYARVQDGEVWLHGVHITPYAFATGFGSDAPERARKLLLHRREIVDLEARTQRESLTLVPLAVYFRQGRAKVELALARGRKSYDKRAAIAERDAGREAARAFRHRGRGEDTGV